MSQVTGSADGTVSTGDSATWIVSLRPARGRGSMSANVSRRAGLDPEATAGLMAINSQVSATMKPHRQMPVLIVDDLPGLWVRLPDPQLRVIAEFGHVRFRLPAMAGAESRGNIWMGNLVSMEIQCRSWTVLDGQFDVNLNNQRTSRRQRPEACPAGGRTSGTAGHPSRTAGRSGCSGWSGCRHRAWAPGMGTRPRARRSRPRWMSASERRLPVDLFPPWRPGARDWFQSDVGDPIDDREVKLAGSFVPGDHPCQGGSQGR